MKPNAGRTPTSRSFSEFSAWLETASPAQTFSEAQIRRELSCLRQAYLHEPAGLSSTLLDDQLTCPLAALGLLARGDSGDLRIPDRSEAWPHDRSANLRPTTLRERHQGGLLAR